MTLKIAVMGAGCVGGWVGARLAGQGIPVTLIGRTRFVEAVRSGGLHATPLTGDCTSVNAPRIELGTHPSLAASADIVLMCVKSRDTEGAAVALAPHLRRDAVVVSLQNGLASVERLRKQLPAHTVLAGMIRFNIVWTDTCPGVHLVQATNGEIVIDAHPLGASLVDAFRAAGIPSIQHSEMVRVQWAKLLLNLNNAINALSGHTLRDELSDRGYRRVLAAAMNEAWTVLREAKIQPAAFGRMRPALAPWILPLPDFWFRLLAAPMIQIHPSARSSMAHDLALGRRTEIADINGAVVALGKRVGVPTPINTHLMGLIRAAEEQGQGSPALPSTALWPPSHPS
ncbi:MAG TPA: 2-dehydropantoate 2-reductase [Deltaproteobacteria bacterium]|nr:2-dehydropantoate 2-reductase [Deltaproteobacteria bacterium]